MSLKFDTINFLIQKLISSFKHENDSSGFTGRKKESNLVSGSMNLVTMVIGSGSLGLPFAFAKAGLVPAILMFVVFGLPSFLAFNDCMYAADVKLTTFLTSPTQRHSQSR
ncbi:hypothetical protein BLNAU_3116 [Blattamonas nauphoetae]|uniref:Amino acid transporter transmembrane domain-containing protein n=1 Tax=Blattamonas nauphoetae TaxID=2049346 RepID=A0ABQ9YEF1_9EUKA|nr:hypothetical protein BLNAU_3116 [Blattamonas nauphoetae]